MSDKAEFLARLQRAIAEPKAMPRVPLASVQGTPVPRITGGPFGVDAFIAGWTLLGGHVHRATERTLNETVATAAGGRGPVVAGSEPMLAGIQADLRWPECGMAATATAQVGVAHAIAGIAATGTLVLDMASARGRALTLLPPVCIFVVRADTIVEAPSDVLRAHRRFWPGGPPSQIVLVTGPSRSGDIEMTLTVGVHGPGEVHAVIVE